MFKLLKRLFLGIISAISLSACSGLLPFDQNYEFQPPETKGYSVKFENNSISLQVGEEKNTRAYVLNESGSNTPIQSATINASSSDLFVDCVANYSAVAITLYTDIENSFKVYLTVTILGGTKVYGTLEVNSYSNQPNNNDNYTADDYNFYASSEEVNLEINVSQDIELRAEGPDGYGKIKEVQITNTKRYFNYDYVISSNKEHATLTLTGKESTNGIYLRLNLVLTNGVNLAKSIRVVVSQGYQIGYSWNGPSPLEYGVHSSIEFFVSKDNDNKQIDHIQITSSDGALPSIDTYPYSTSYLYEFSPYFVSSWTQLNIYVNTNDGMYYSTYINTSVLEPANYQIGWDILYNDGTIYADRNNTVEFYVWSPGRDTKVMTGIMIESYNGIVPNTNIGCYSQYYDFIFSTDGRSGSEHVHITISTNDGGIYETDLYFDVFPSPDNQVFELRFDYGTFNSYSYTDVGVYVLGSYGAFKSIIRIDYYSENGRISSNSLYPYNTYCQFTMYANEPGNDNIYISVVTQDGTTYAKYFEIYIN